MRENAVGVLLGKPKNSRMDAAPPPPRLLTRLREHLRARHYSIRTEAAYVDWVRRFILFHGKRHPQDMAQVCSGVAWAWSQGS